MKVLVAVKRVIDYNIKIRVKPDHTGVDLSNVKMALNPFCEIAVEEAVQLKERGVADETVAVSVGTDVSQEQLRTALALGIDRAVLVKTDTDTGPLGVARLLQAVVEKEQPDLIILGKQAIDGDSNQVGQMLAALLERPQGTFASKLEIEGDHALVTREIDGGLRTERLALPAVITTDLRLNEPRFASLPNVMKAKRKPLDVLQAEELGVDTASSLEVVAVEPPPEREAGILVDSVDELIEKLKQEAKVI